MLDPSARLVPDSSQGEDGVWDRRVVALLAGLVAFRVLYAWIFPLDLAPDESYYWDWGRRPAMGYFSKPPMIGWLMALAGGLGRDSEFMLKLAPGILSATGLCFVYLLGRDMFGGRVGWVAVLLLVAMPAQVALSTFFTIDAPLFLFWSASLWFAWRWWSGPGRVGWGLLLVASMGAGFLTKQIQLVFPLLFLCFLALSTRSRGSGARLGAFLGITALALLFLSPPLLWNWQHDWITFRHTADEISHNPLRLWRSLKFFLEFIGGQAGLGGGVTWVLLVASLWYSLRNWRTEDDRARFLVLFAVPGLVAFAAFAFRQRVEQNWPMVFYTTAVVLLASRLTGDSAQSARWARFFRPAVALGGGLACLLLLVPFVLPFSPISGAKADPTGRIRGWRLLAEKVAPLRARVPRPERTFILAPDDRYVASALAFYLPDRPRTYGWEDPARPESQYGIWGRPADRVGWDALVVCANPASPPSADVAGRFASWERVGEIVIELGARPDRNRRYTVFLGRSLTSVGGGPSESGATPGSVPP